MVRTLFLFTLLTVSGLIAAAKTADTLKSGPVDWPERVTYPDDIMVKIVAEAVSPGGSRYRTNHFELISDFPLQRQALCQVLEVMEATLAGIRAMPLGWEIELPLERYVVKLLNGEERFANQGGIPGAGGIYLPESRETLIRIDTLQAEISSAGCISAIRRPGLIAHEITHQIQHDWLKTLPAWLIEGMAMYMESVPFDHGTFEFQKSDFKIAAGVRRCTQNHYRIIDLETLMTMERTEWNQHFTANPNDNDRYYLSAYLLTYYFMHLAGAEDASDLRRFIGAMMSAKDENSRKQALEQLLQGRGYEGLQSELGQAYAEDGFIVEPLKGYQLAAVCLN